MRAVSEKDELTTVSVRPSACQLLVGVFVACGDAQLIREMLEPRSELGTARAFRT